MTRMTFTHVSRRGGVYEVCAEVGAEPEAVVATHIRARNVADGSVLRIDDISLGACPGHRPEELLTSEIRSRIDLACHR